MKEAVEKRDRHAPADAELKWPSVYLGLENVVFDQTYCRSRGTFPKAFATYDTLEGEDAALRRVHAPDDKTTLVFGGPVRLSSPRFPLCVLGFAYTHPRRSARSSTCTSPTMASRTAPSAPTAPPPTSAPPWT